MPDLPDVMSTRSNVVAEMRSHLLDSTASSDKVTLASNKKGKLTAHGQGGVGKTTMAVAIVHDEINAVEMGRVVR